MPCPSYSPFAKSFVLTLALVPSAILGGCQTPQPKFQPHQELGLENAKPRANAHPPQVKIPVLSQKTSIQKSF